MGIWHVEGKGWRYSFEAYGERFSQAWFGSRSEAKKARDEHKAVMGFSPLKKNPCILKHYGEKQRARLLFYYVFKQMDVEKPKNCRICGKERKLLPHHEDYSKPFKIRWVCRSCHTSIHAKDLTKNPKKTFSAHGERVNAISKFFGIEINL